MRANCPHSRPRDCLCRDRRLLVVRENQLTRYREGSMRLWQDILRRAAAVAALPLALGWSPL